MTLHIILFISFVYGFVASVYLIKRHTELNEKLENTFEYVNGLEYIFSLFYGIFGCVIFGPAIIAAGYLLIMDFGWI